MLEHEAKEQHTVLKESVQIQDAYDKDVDRLKTLIEDAQKQMSSNPVKHKNIDALKKQIAEHKVKLFGLLSKHNKFMTFLASIMTGGTNYRCVWSSTLRQCPRGFDARGCFVRRFKTHV